MSDEVLRRRLVHQLSPQCYLWSRRTRHYDSVCASEDRAATLLHLRYSWQETRQQHSDILHEQAGHPRNARSRVKSLALPQEEISYLSRTGSSHFSPLESLFPFPNFTAPR